MVNVPGRLFGLCTEQQQKLREVVKKNRSFYGQADRKGLPPPYGQGVVIFSK